ncbi:hypothetical protein RJ640_024005 [Escallonia rubra]|uniref:Uncharacterized protein n=1 Tax=Escallonia rubra TaxID=112253 RepID=A0AA88USB7_9ASTE|nr:hypothetical protein RJ640_024005 [Escallonia rubra]
MDSSLDQALIKGQWTDEEDRKLIRLVKKHGVRKWAHLAEKVIVAPLASGLAQWLDPFSPEADRVSPHGVTSGSNPSFVIGDPMKKVQWVETTRRA